MIPPGPTLDGLPLPDDRLLSIWLMRSIFRESDPQLQEEDAWGFPFHYSCWEFIALVRPDDPVNVQTVFNVLRSFPVQDGFINFGHDYGGDAHYKRFAGTVRVGKEPRLVQGPTSEHQTCNPLEIPELRHFFVEDSRHSELPHDVGLHATCSITGDDPLSRLPAEILQYVFVQLPTRDVLRLRLSSKACANIPLSQSFWLSRFLPGWEFEAVFEARQETIRLKGRWKHLYRLVKSIQQSDALANRKRVYKLACSLRNIMDQVTSTSLCGDSEGIQFRRWVSAHPAHKHRDTFFSKGSRDFCYRRCTIPASSIQVFISLVEIFGRRYVSGLRFVPASGSHTVLGYRHAAGEALVSVSGEIAGFHIAQDERGFQGLAVLLASGALSNWAGNHRGVPIRRLVLDHPTDAYNGVTHLRCGFDVSFCPYPE